MPWLSLLFMLIRYLPDMIELISKIIELFRKDPKQFTEADFHELRQAAKQAHRTGDKKPLREAVERLRNRFDRAV